MCSSDLSHGTNCVPWAFRLGVGNQATCGKNPRHLNPCRGYRYSWRALGVGPGLLLFYLGLGPERSERVAHAIPDTRFQIPQAQQARNARSLRRSPGFRKARAFPDTRQPRKVRPSRKSRNARNARRTRAAAPSDSAEGTEKTVNVCCADFAEPAGRFERAERAEAQESLGSSEQERWGRISDPIMKR